MAMSKNHKIIIAVVVSVLVLTGLGVGLYFALRTTTPAVKELEDIVQRAKNVKADDKPELEAIKKDYGAWQEKYDADKIKNMSSKDQDKIDELGKEYTDAMSRHEPQGGAGVLGRLQNMLPGGNKE
ncbi:Uncharacterized protein PBTT_10034 [Plasmodiophora brassicae]|uniref:Uncharacterized protein n=1 Tax=Plasmodiophora brassicae TaxID=37360 RepID=A0A0G4IP03_PLABS|nr:hypothetical protein PBRA_005585 [Plasmodiophora brassicae]